MKLSCGIHGEVVVVVKREHGEDEILKGEFDWKALAFRGVVVKVLVLMIVIR